MSEPIPLSRVVEVSRAVGATRSRTAKTELVAQVLRETPPAQVRTVASLSLIHI